MLLCWVSEVLLPMFSARTFMVSRIIFKSFNYFEFIMVYGVSWWSSFIFLLVLVQISPMLILMVMQQTLIIIPVRKHDWKLPQNHKDSVVCVYTGIYTYLKTYSHNKINGKILNIFFVRERTKKVYSHYYKYINKYILKTINKRFENWEEKGKNIFSQITRLFMKKIQRNF